MERYNYDTSNAPTWAKAAIANEDSSFLTVHSCLRSNEGDFSKGPASYYVIVLSGIKAEAARPPQLRCRAYLGSRKNPFAFHTCDATLLAEHRVDDWIIHEYSVLIPTQSRLAFLRDGRHTVVLSGKQFTQFKQGYDRMIANASVDPSYPQWLKCECERLAALPEITEGPKISIIMPAYKTPPGFLGKAIDSIVAQTYKNWELIIINASPGETAMGNVIENRSEDDRIRVIEQEENLGIAGNTNIGIHACTGDYVAFFDHDDTVEPFALREMVKVINDSNGEVGLLYCDEDNIDEHDTPLLPLFKPDYNPDLLINDNYVIHWLTVRRDFLNKVELSGDDVTGAQDYDLTLKVIEAGAKVAHIPHVLYHWRIHSGSTAGNPGEKSYAQSAGLLAVKRHVERTGTNATVQKGWAPFTYEVRYNVPEPAPSLIVSTVGGISQKTTEALIAYEQCHGAHFAIYNDAAKLCSAVHRAEPHDIFLFVTPQHDIEADSLELLVGAASQPRIACVSPRVVRKDGLLDYAGAIMTSNGYQKLLHLLPQEDGGYVGRAQRPYSAYVVNPDFYAVKMEVLNRVGSMQSSDFSACFALELFVRAYGLGFNNTYYPYASAQLNDACSTLGKTIYATQSSARIGSITCDPSLNQNFDSSSTYYCLASK